MFTFRDPAKNVRIDLPNQRKKYHNSDGVRSWTTPVYCRRFADRQRT